MPKRVLQRTQPTHPADDASRRCQSPFAISLKTDAIMSRGRVAGAGSTACPRLGSIWHQECIRSGAEVYPWSSSVETSRRRQHLKIAAPPNPISSRHSSFIVAIFDKVGELLCLTYFSSHEQLCLCW